MNRFGVACVCDFNETVQQGAGPWIEEETSMSKHLIRRAAIAVAALAPVGAFVGQTAASATTTAVGSPTPICCFKFVPTVTASNGGDFDGVVVQGNFFQVDRPVRVELYDRNSGVPLNYTYVTSNTSGSFTWNDIPDPHLTCSEPLTVRAYDTTVGWVYATGVAGCKIP